jgi:branched-chain amino acid transport system ATP-binding protein
MSEFDGRPSVLTVSNLVAGYTKGIDIVRGASLEVREKEIVCILGPNGAGKSTLIKSIFGLVKVRSGAVSINGRNMVGVPSHQMVHSGVGYVPQTDDVFAELTVEENLRMGGFTNRKAWGEQSTRIYDWFPVLAEKRNNRAGGMSGGQRRLLGVGRALMTNPTLLLLDEPSAGLSPANVHEVFTRIDQVRRDGVAVAMVEQNAVEGLDLADTGYILDQGKEEIRGPAESILGNPRVRELYLGLAAAASPEPASGALAKREGLRDG